MLSRHLIARRRAHEGGQADVPRAKAQRRQRRTWWAAGAVAVAALIGLAVLAGRASGGGAGSATLPPSTSPPSRTTPGSGSRVPGQAGGRQLFASCCTSCDFELPGFARVSDELRDQVSFVGVAALETGDPMTMPERHGITWWPLARDIGSRDNDLHAALGMPITAYYYDDTGNLLHVYTGAIDEAALRERITSLYQIEV